MMVDTQQTQGEGGFGTASNISPPRSPNRSFARRSRLILQEQQESLLTPQRGVIPVSAEMIDYHWLTKQVQRRRSFMPSTFPRKVKPEILEDAQLAGNMIQLMDSKESTDQQDIAADPTVLEIQVRQDSLASNGSQLKQMRTSSIFSLDGGRQASIIFGRSDSQFDMQQAFNSKSSFINPIGPSIQEYPEEEEITPFDGADFLETVMQEKKRPRSKSLQFSIEYLEATEQDFFLARMLLLTCGQNSSFKKRRRLVSVNNSPPRSRFASYNGKGTTIGKESNTFGIDTSLVLHSMNMNEIEGNDENGEEYIQMDSGQNTANQSFQILNMTSSARKMIKVSEKTESDFSESYQDIPDGVANNEIDPEELNKQL